MAGQVAGAAVAEIGLGGSTAAIRPEKPVATEPGVGAGVRGEEEGRRAAGGGEGDRPLSKACKTSLALTVRYRLANYKHAVKPY